MSIRDRLRRKPTPTSSSTSPSPASAPASGLPGYDPTPYTSTDTSFSGGHHSTPSHCDTSSHHSSPSCDTSSSDSGGFDSGSY
jgi:hypothetical protein